MTNTENLLKTAHRIPIMAEDLAAGEGWYHIIPIGEHKIVAYDAADKPQIITELVDQVAVDRIMAAHAALAGDPEWPGYLVGREHESQDPDGSTEAYAWGLELATRIDDPDPRARGIWMRAKKTALGQQTIGSVYKFFSTVNNLEPVEGRAATYRPIDIEDVGLTNKPAYRTLKPARHSAAAGSDVRATRMSPSNNPQEELMLEKLKLLLARHKVELAADAGEDAVREALETALTAAAGVPDLTQRVTKAEHRLQELDKADVGQLTTRAETAEARVKELETADLERRADVFVAQHSALIKDPKAVRDLYIKSPDSAEAMLGQIKPPPPPDQGADGKARVFHRADATPPDRSPTAGDQDADRQLDHDRETYVQQLKAEHRLPSWSAAWALASQLRPEMFISRN